mmetsp:Transcript_91111/g.167260  ORF Transcript_91111/g.167260 Transcript_91111/m.167260 type:complete len:205 (-) Transcript_91111:128-742(-)
MAVAVPMPSSFLQAACTKRSWKALPTRTKESSEDTTKSPGGQQRAKLARPSSKRSTVLSGRLVLLPLAGRTGSNEKAGMRWSPPPTCRTRTRRPCKAVMSTLFSPERAERCSATRSSAFNVAPPLPILFVGAVPSAFAGSPTASTKVAKGSSQTRPPVSCRRAGAVAELELEELPRLPALLRWSSRLYASACAGRRAVMQMTSQ